MIQYLIKRVFWAVFVLWAVVSVVFVLLNMIGDPAMAQLGPRAQASQVEAFRHAHGLDKPLHMRYFKLMNDLAHGHLGDSFRDHRPVWETIKTRLPRTALLGGLAMLIELHVGLLIGLIAAALKRTVVDRTLMAVSFLGVSTPSFIWGLFLLDVVAFRLGWFPVGGLGVGFTDQMRHALLPAITLAILGASNYARMMRSELLDILNQDYIRTARAKGAGPLRTLILHATPNAMLPIITMIGMQLPMLVSGAIVTETIFSWPGMGRLAIESIYTPDFPMVLAIVIIACVMVQVGNLLADLGVAAIDPRVRLDG